MRERSEKKAVRWTRMKDRGSWKKIVLMEWFRTPETEKSTRTAREREEGGNTLSYHTSLVASRAVPLGAKRVEPMVAPMDEHWVAVMVVLMDATRAVCSVDERGVPLVVAKGAQTVGH